MTRLVRLLRRLARGGAPSPGPVAEIPVLDPFDGPVYAVGDVHGCLALYLRIEARILADAARFDGPATIVLLGDMVDRGPQTAELIDHLLRPMPAPARRLCLRGNHEAMMLDFLAAPRAGAAWLGLGGQETLASYGMRQGAEALTRLGERQLRQALGAHLPASHVGFLRQLLPGVQVGRWLLAHAGADSHAPLTAQPVQALLWGAAGLSAPGGLTLIHGHHVTAEPEIGVQRIGIDTGAYATGRLTALRLRHGHPPALLTGPAEMEFREIAPPPGETPTDSRRSRPEAGAPVPEPRPFPLVTR